MDDGDRCGKALVSSCFDVVENGLRGPPQMLSLLELLGRRSEQCMSSPSAATPAVAAVLNGQDEDSESTALAYVCDALVNGNGGEGSQSGADSSLAARANAGSVEAVEAYVKQQVKLSFPLAFLKPQQPLPTVSSSFPQANASLTTSVDKFKVRKLCQDLRLVRRLLLPLLERWQRGERKRLMDAQSTAAKHAFLKTDEDTRRETNESMSALLDTLLDELFDRQVSTSCWGSHHRSATNLGDIFGSLAEVTGSFRALCIGATLLFFLHLFRLVRLAVGGQERDMAKDESAKGDELHSPKCSANGSAAAQMASVPHAAALMTEWTQYFARHGGGFLYETELQDQLREAERKASLSFANSCKKQVTSSDESAPHVEVGATMDEVQWSFVMSLLVCVREDLMAGARAASPLPSLNGAGAQAAFEQEQEKRDVMLGFIGQVQLLLERFARVHLSVSVVHRFSHMATTMAARNYPVTRRYLWECCASKLSLTDTVSSTAHADDGKQDNVEEAKPHPFTCADGTPDWASVLQLLSQLTATQPPAEEAAASSVISVGEHGYGLGSSGFYLGSSSSGVLGVMSRRVAACEAAVLEASPTTTAVPVERRKRLREEDDLLSREARKTPKTRLLHYLAFVFYPVYHPSCFTILQSEGEWLRSRSLESLHGLLHSTPPADSGAPLLVGTLHHEKKNAEADVNANYDDGWSSSSSEDGNKNEDEMTAPAENQGADAERDEPLVAQMPAPRQQLLHLLQTDARLPLMLAHGVLTHLERRGKVGTEDTAALTAWLIPSLITLGGSGDWAGSKKMVTGLSSLQWSLEQQSTFCLLALISSGLLMALPWNIAGMYLCLRRYNELARQLREEQLYNPNGACVCLARLREWVEEGAGGVVRPLGTPSSLVCTAVDEVIEETDVFYQQLKNATTVGTTTGDAVLEERLRMVTPLCLPSPCGLIVVIAACRTLSRQFYLLRNAYEEQRAITEETAGGYDYLNRGNTFCTTDDIRAFRVAVHTTHRMVFGFQPQTHGLLKLWLASLRHLFYSFVPAAADEDAVRLMPASWQQQTVTNCFGDSVPRRGWRAAVKTPGTRYSSQTELRAALGAALADLVLMPLADAHAPLECPTAFPLMQHTPEWTAHQRRWAQEQRLVESALPVVTLEAICFLLAIDTESPVPLSRAEVSGSPTSPRVAASGARHGVDDGHSLTISSEIDDDLFLGLQGLAALCQQLERRIVPGSIASPRVAHLIRCLWASADAAALGR